MDACAELTHPDPGRPGLRRTTLSWAVKRKEIKFAIENSSSLFFTCKRAVERVSSASEFDTGARQRTPFRIPDIREQ